MSLVIAINGKFQEYKLPSSTPLKRSQHANAMNSDFSKLIKERGLEKGHSNKDSPPKSSQKFKEGVNKQYERVQKGIPQKRPTILAQDIMTKDVHYLSTEAIVGEAIDLMQQYNIRHLPILHQSQLIGIVTERDILGMRGRNVTHLPIVDVYIKEVIATKNRTEIQILARIMVEESISCLPVIDEDDHFLVGILTHIDILKCVMNNISIELWI